MTKSEKFQQLSPEIQEDIKKGLEKLKSKNDKWLNKDVTENFESLEALETEVGLDFSRDAAIFFCQNPNGTKDKPWFFQIASKFVRKPSIPTSEKSNLCRKKPVSSALILILT